MARSAGFCAAVAVPSLSLGFAAGWLASKSLRLPLLVSAVLFAIAVLLLGAANAAVLPEQQPQTACTFWLICSYADMCVLESFYQA